MPGADPGLTVLDASVAVRWLTEEVGSQAARDLLEDNLRWMAPRLLLVEMAAALRRKTLLGLIEADVARDGLRFIIEMVHRGTIQLREDENLIQKALDLSLALQHKVPDCLYLALAEKEGASLATADIPLAKLAALRAVPVKLVPSAV